jgi:RND family efflux transporter MFP subunit
MRVLFAFILFAVTCLVSAQQPASTINVNVVYPKQVESTSSITLSGTVEAKQTSELASLEAGVVSEILVDIGESVNKGQTLLRLNDDLGAILVEGAKASMESARINLAEAKRLYTEVLALSEKQVVAQSLIAERAALLANAESELARAEADLALQQEVLARHTLQAPFAGVISQRNADVGEWITQQSTVLTLVDQGHLRVNIAIPQQYFALLANSNQVPVTVLPDVQSIPAINASLSRFVPVSQGNSRSFQALIDLPQNSQLVPGMSARAQIQLPNTTENTFSLPLSAIKQHPDGGSSVFVLENGKAKRIITSYMHLPNGQVSISNQNADLPYIVSGIEVLRDGMSVTATNISATINLEANL